MMGLPSCKQRIRQSSILRLQAAGGEAAGAGGEAAELQAQLDEQQQEFNDLLACLGQETAKVFH